jgi:hypothetical protein
MSTSIDGVLKISVEAMSQATFEEKIDRFERGFAVAISAKFVE